ncbi:MAG TPA: PSD1 and planctomycete cytochrome C domain-containing protein [Planctomycetota bacterium]|nr:PSD1 and planctomycete cytochrome C domain-containing protein [Planctomycetota bacterium]
MNARLFFLTLVLTVPPATLRAAEGRVAAPDFSREILPILSENCFYCHGPDPKNRKADMRLDVESDAKKERDDLVAIMPGSSAKSEMAARISSHDPDTIMPPPKSNKSLSKEQIALIARWIDSGAKWGVHWSLSELKRPDVPLMDGPVPQNPIDAFVAMRLKREELSFAPEAEKTALLRRATLALTGLPPSRERLASFLADTSNDAYEKEVDRLLASSAYGERMAWDWMEAARYADSNGYQGDGERTMWPWRDWVVKAFNENMPYDRFTIMQLAGDQLPNATPEEKLATGFLRNHAINGEGGRIAEENRVEYVMDMTETTATVWMAMTFTCCRCHDHKFDPFTRRDYYSLFAFFNQTPVDGGGGDPQTKPALAVSTPEQDAELAQLDKHVVELDARVQARAKEIAPNQDEWERKALDGAGPAEKNAWIVLAPTDVKAEKQTLAILNDKSVLASGPNPANDAYTFFAPAPLKKITAVRLEALRHESMTKGGLARSDSGNFVLTNIEVRARKAGETEAHAQKIASAKASFEQSGFKIANAFDNDPKSGWAVWEGRAIDRDHEAVFILEKPVEAGADAGLVISLRFDSPHVSHNLGHFRLSVSEEKDPQLVRGKLNLQTILRIPAKQRNAEQAKAVTEAFHNADDALTKLQAELKAAKERADAFRKALPKVMVMEDMPKPRKTLMLEKGLYNKTGEEVHAATPASLPPMPADAPRTRLGLARWLVARENPLTARVTVNRVWQMFFGVGLVKTAEDFGVKAEFPKHPELLDFLAAEFRDSGWDMKKLIRQIVTSRTYRQSSRVPAQLKERDPENRLLARGPRFRMSSWMLRDQALAASGLLVNKIGGAPVKPYQPSGVWEEATFGNKRYTQDKGEALYRRSLYTFWRRIVGPVEFFDTQARSTCVVKPTRTNSPLHALTTLNDTTFVEAARNLAERAVKWSAQQNNERVKFVFESVLARDARPEEVAVLLTGIERSTKQFAANHAEAKKFIAVGESKRDEKIDAIELAAWTVLCLTVLNLDEALTLE